MPKLSFVSDETVRIDLDEGTWVEARKSLSFAEFQKLIAHIDMDDEIKSIAVAIPLLKAALVNWSDESVECTPENIEKLETAVILALVNEVFPLYTPEKKS